MSNVADIAGFASPSAPTSPTSQYADLWGFGNDESVEIVDNGPVQSPDGAGTTTSHLAPPTPLLNFMQPIPDVVASTTGVRNASDASLTAFKGTGEALNQ